MGRGRDAQFQSTFRRNLGVLYGNIYPSAILECWDRLTTGYYQIERTCRQKPKLGYDIR